MQGGNKNYLGVKKQNVFLQGAGNHRWKVDYTCGSRWKARGPIRTKILKRT